MNANNNFKIALTGGGTMGSVSPLIAVYQELKKKDSRWEAIWIGTEDGPEKPVIEELGIKFYAIKSGRLRRFFTLKNLIDPFKIWWGIHQSKKILKQFKPAMLLTAGSFVAYPVAKAAKKLGIPYFIHQQDIVKGLANSLMQKDAAGITVAFDLSLEDFDIKKTYITSNPARQDRLQCDKSKAIEMFNLDPQRRTVLIMGGGTGAAAINELTLEALGKITEQNQVVHLTGQGKSVEHLIEDFFDRETQIRIRKNYHHVEFLNEGMCEILNYADVVVSRAGLSSLTELSLLHKAAIIIPIPDSHQEKNALYFAKNNAVKYFNQNELTGEKLALAINQLLSNPPECQGLGRNIGQLIDPKAAEKYVSLIYKFLQI